MHLFARVRCQGDIEDAEVVRFNSELGMRCVCCEGVLWGRDPFEGRTEIPLMSVSCRLELTQD